MAVAVLSKASHHGWAAPAVLASPDEIAPDKLVWPATVDSAQVGLAKLDISPYRRRHLPESCSAQGVGHLVGVELKLCHLFQSTCSCIQCT